MCSFFSPLLLFTNLPLIKVINCYCSLAQTLVTPDLKTTHRLTKSDACVVESVVLVSLRADTSESLLVLCASVRAGSEDTWRLQTAYFIWVVSAIIDAVTPQLAADTMASSTVEVSCCAPVRVLTFNIKKVVKTTEVRVHNDIYLKYFITLKETP